MSTQTHGQVSELNDDDLGAILIHKALPGPMPKKAMCGFVIRWDNSAGLVEVLTEEAPVERCEPCDVAFLNKMWRVD